MVGKCGKKLKIRFRVLEPIVVLTGSGYLLAINQGRILFNELCTKNIVGTIC